MKYFSFCLFQFYKALSLIEDEDAKLVGADIILHVPDLEINGLTNEDSDESDDKEQGNKNHLGKRMLNMLCDVVSHYQYETPEVMKHNPQLLDYNLLHQRKRKNETKDD